MLALPLLIRADEYQVGEERVGPEYSVLDANGVVLICNRPYYPTAPDYNLARLIVEAVNKGAVNAS